VWLPYDFICRESLLEWPLWAFSRFFASISMKFSVSSSFGIYLILNFRFLSSSEFLSRGVTSLCHFILSEVLSRVGLSSLLSTFLLSFEIKLSVSSSLWNVIWNEIQCLFRLSSCCLSVNKISFTFFFFKDLVSYHFLNFQL